MGNLFNRFAILSQADSIRLLTADCHLDPSSIPLLALIFLFRVWYKRSIILDNGCHMATKGRGDMKRWYLRSKESGGN